MRPALLMFLLAGYAVALVPARRCHRDIGRFRRNLWVGYGSRDRWLRGIELAYVAGGWPALAVALAWRRSTTREGLVELRDRLREVQDEPERSGAGSGSPYGWVATPAAVRSSPTRRGISTRQCDCSSWARVTRKCPAGAPCANNRTFQTSPMS